VLSVELVQAGEGQKAWEAKLMLLEVVCIDTDTLNWLLKG